MYLLVLLSALSASTFTLGKALLHYAPPLFLIGIRMLSAGLLFMIYYAMKYKRIMKFRLKDSLLFMQATIMGFCLSFVFEFWALQYLTSAKTAFLYNLSPFMAAIFSYFFFHEKMTIKKFLGLIIGVLGFLPVLLAEIPAEGSAILFLSWPELSMVSAVVCYTYGWIIMRTLIKTRKYEGIVVNGIGMTCGGLLVLLASFISELPYNKAVYTISWLPVTQWLPFIFLMLALVIVGNIICYTLYGYFLKRYTATFVTFADFTGPFFAALYGFIFLGESVPWYFWVSIMIVFCGFYLFYQEELKLGYLESEDAS